MYNNEPKEDLCEISRKYGHEEILRMRDNARIITPEEIALLRQTGSQTPTAGAAAVAQPPQAPRDPRIRFFDTDELAQYVPERDIVLVGDCHVMRGEMFIIGGEQGVGKSRASTWFAVCGALGIPWFGIEIKRRFKTMIVQTENGRYRLRQEFSALDHQALKGWIRVSEPPPFGLTLGNPEFQHDIRAALAGFQPDCVILDPWNSAARDDKQRDYSETFTALQSLLPTGPDRPSLGIVAHTRKPQAAEKRTGGTGLMHILAGSYMLTSVPRCVFVMTRATDDESDDRVVWFNPKNNNGQLIPRTAWRRGNCGFEAVPDFDWEAFDDAALKAEKTKVTIGHLRELFESCDTMELSDAVEQLTMIADVSRPTAYGLFGEKSRFAANLIRNGKMVTFKE